MPVPKVVGRCLEFSNRFVLVFNLNISQIGRSASRFRTLEHFVNEINFREVTVRKEVPRFKIKLIP